jgi:insertion element IS1 protein InsB
MSVNYTYINAIDPSKAVVEILSWDEVCESELDEMWSFVRTKKNQRWLWLAIDHETRNVLAFVFGRRKHKVFKELKALLKPFGIKRFFTDDFGAYTRNLTEHEHVVGKENTQRIERKNLTLRTRIKRLCRKTICYSKCENMHDTVVGLVINVLEFGLRVDRLFNYCLT